MTEMLKYPRTPHLEGSRLQPGDEDLGSTPFANIKGKHLVVEEKMDGANCGISFDDDGRLLLQSRGHFLTGGPRERQFDLLKSWAQAHNGALFDVLGRRYIAYGEWLYARHTVFYDSLPHFFIEFDVFDRDESVFLSAARRRVFWDGTKVLSAPVLHEGPIARISDLISLIGPSQLTAQSAGSRFMEGLYIKVEGGDRVVDRYKFVRAEFAQAIADSASHWMDRPPEPNRLRVGVDIFAGLQ